MKHHELRPTELAMRTVILIQQDRIKRPRLAYAEHLMREFGVHASTAYRYIATACDVLALNLPMVDPQEVQDRRALTMLQRGTRTGGLHGRKPKRGSQPRWSQFADIKQ